MILVWFWCGSSLEGLAAQLKRTSERPHQMHLALFQPDIPPNTGTILRLCACLDVAAHIIEPTGFAVSDRAFRRAGMCFGFDVSRWKFAKRLGSISC